MKTSNYRLHVAVIDVDDVKEKELNILLNNSSAQGDWDIEALADLLKTEGLKLEGTGFESADIFNLFGGDIFQNRDDEDLEKLAKTLEEHQEKYAKIAEKNADRDSDRFYLVMVFKSQADVIEFIDSRGLPDNRYQSGEDIKQLTLGRKIGAVRSAGSVSDGPEDGIVGIELDGSVEFARQD